MKRLDAFKLLHLCWLAILAVSMIVGYGTDVFGEKSATAKKRQTKQLTPEEEAGVRLVALSKKGYISLQIAEPSTFMLVEPKVWRAMMHQDKVNLCQTALIFLQGYKRQKLSKISYLIVWDMTSHDTIARAYLDDNRIEILR
ncbi:MAG: hypothetical protein A4E58_02088 [Syntrophorhabdus sp. PtaB.Bin006]|nr:MAG: hypothetical protein A4E58_02088 [Syntrophorhabdus sp. PtaB.Bin006]